MIERELNIAAELIEDQESMAALEYMSARGFGVDFIFERENHSSPFHDVHPLVINNDPSNMVAHGLVSACFPDEPNGNLFEEADRLISNYSGVKERLESKIAEDPRYSDKDYQVIRDFDLGKIASFANEVFQAYLKDAKEGTFGRLPAENAWQQDSDALYWLRIRTVALAAIIRAGEIEDPVI